MLAHIICLIPGKLVSYKKFPNKKFPNGVCLDSSSDLLKTLPQKFSFVLLSELTLTISHNLAASRKYGSLEPSSHNCFHFDLIPLKVPAAVRSSA